jgi:hypothetical protein
MRQDKRAKEGEGKGGRQAELNRPKRGAASGLGSYGVASGFAGGSSGHQPVTGLGGRPVWRGLMPRIVSAETGTALNPF